MINTTLIFPDTFELSDFVIESNASNIEVNTKELSITATLPEAQILDACTKHKAHFKKMHNVFIDDEEE